MLKRYELLLYMKFTAKVSKVYIKPSIITLPTSSLIPRKKKKIFI